MFTREDQKRLDYVKECFHQKNVYNFSDSDVQELQDLLSLLRERKVLQDLEVDNANAFLKTGNFEIFEKWIKEVNNKMKASSEISPYAEQVLRDIIEHKNEHGNYDIGYWEKRFENLSVAEDSLLRSCFKELHDFDFVQTKWADDCPYIIFVTGKGLSYYDKMTSSIQDIKDDNPFSPDSLIAAANEILKTEYHKPEPGLIIPDYVSGKKYNRWIGDLRVLQSSLPTNCPLKDELGRKKYYSDSSVSTVEQIIGLLESIKNWNNSVRSEETLNNEKRYDVFLSHASKDKLDYVNNLYETLRKLGISIFYDKDSISWGDNWKEAILDGTADSEFAIIVISEHFFDRKWTERELSEFLNRQNSTGQKIVLPLLYNITINRLNQKYPSLEDIHVLETRNLSEEEITILFARELIKRLRK